MSSDDTSPGTIQIPIKPTTSTTFTAEGQLIHTRPKQQCNTDTMTTLLDQLQKLLNNHKRQVHQVNKPNTKWDLNTAAKLPQ